MNSNQPIISVEGLEVGYGDQVILHDITFEVRRGEVLVIAGGSGSGKSTLLMNMIGLHKPTRGRILIDGDDVATAEGARLAQLIRKFGVAFQGGALFGSMTVLENAKLPIEEFTQLPEEITDLIALSNLQLVDLADAALKLPSELSGGMQKRAAIARAMALDPAILFLDEPSSGLDPITSAALDQLILTLNDLRGTTFVIVSHELPSIFAIADRVLVLNGSEKTMVALGEPATLRDHSPNPWLSDFLNRRSPQSDLIKSHAATKAAPPVGAT